MPIPAILLPGLKLPVIAAPMFRVSGTQLVIETCKQAVIGTLPALNARTSSELDDWLHEIDAALDGQGAARYGVMLALRKLNKRLEQDLEIVLRHRVPLVITAVGHRPDVVGAVHAHGVVVFHDAILASAIAQPAASSGPAVAPARCGQAARGVSTARWDTHGSADAPDRRRGSYLREPGASPLAVYLKQPTSQRDGIARRLRLR